MGIDDGVGTGQPLVILAQMQQVPVHLQQHLLGQFVRELGLEVTLLAISALLGPLVLFLLPHPTHLFHSQLPKRSAHLQLLLDFECFDVDQPPAALLVLDKIPHQLTQIHSSLKTHIPHDFFEKGQGLLQMPPIHRLDNGDSLLRNAVLRKGDQKAFVLRDGLIVEISLVGDEEAVRVGFSGEDSAAKKGAFAVAFDVFLEGDELVSHLLQGEVVQIPGVEQFDVVAEVVVAVLVDETLHGGSEFVGGAEAGDLAHVVLEGDVGVYLHSPLRIGVYPHQGLLFVVDHQSVGYEQVGGFLGLDEFLPEIGARLEPFVLVAILVENRVGLLFQRQHHCLVFLFHQSIIIENQLQPNPKPIRPSSPS